MTVDTAPLIAAVEDIVGFIFQYAPLGILIIGPVAAIGVGLKFGRQIVSMISGAFGGGK